jgi:hypothetical protein
MHATDIGFLVHASDMFMRIFFTSTQPIQLSFDGAQPWQLSSKAVQTDALSNHPALPLFLRLP